MAENPKKNIGDLGENLAKQYLLKKGYKILLLKISDGSVMKLI